MGKAAYSAITRSHVRIINPFFYPVSLAAGALHFGVWRYFLIAFAGKTIKTTAIAYAGYFGLRGIFEVFGISL